MDRANRYASGDVSASTYIDPANDVRPGCERSATAAVDALVFDDNPRPTDRVGDIEADEPTGRDPDCRSANRQYRREEGGQRRLAMPLKGSHCVAKERGEREWRNA
jgi:hypothetical protein